jgi:hypothetical protein
LRLPLIRTESFNWSFVFAGVKIAVITSLDSNFMASGNIRLCGVGGGRNPQSRSGSGSVLRRSVLNVFGQLASVKGAPSIKEYVG